MRFCEAHWQMLRDAVEARGMSHLVAASGEEAAQNIVLELQGREEVFDPLMGAHWRIANRVLRNIAKAHGPTAALEAMADPDFCPLCVVQKSYDSIGDGPRPEYAMDAQGWVNETLDGALQYARENGLMPGVQ